MCWAIFVFIYSKKANTRQKFKKKKKRKQTNLTLKSLPHPRLIEYVSTRTYLYETLLQANRCMRYFFL